MERVAQMAFMVDDLSRICSFCGETGHLTGHCTVEPTMLFFDAEDDVGCVDVFSSLECWQIGQAMKRVESTREFAVKKMFPIGRYEFKFIVNRDYWRCSNKHRRGYSHDVENNFVEVFPLAREAFIYRFPPHGQGADRSVSEGCEVIFLLSCFALNSMVREHSTSQTSAVELWGCWNGWSHGTPMAPEKGSSVLVLRAVKQLERHAYQYKFTISGQWANDPYRRSVHVNGCLNHILDLSGAEPLADGAALDFSFLGVQNPMVELIATSTTNNLHIYAHQMSAVGDRVYLLGGKIRDTVVNTMFVYDPGIGSAEQVAMSDPSGPPPLAFHKMVAHGDKLLVMGASHRQVYGTLYTYSTTERCWYQHSVNDSVLERENYSLAFKKDTARAYLFGGYCSSSEADSDTNFNDLHVFYLNLYKFSKLKAVDRSAPSGRSSHSADLVDWRMHVFGGCQISGVERRLFDELWVIDLFDHENLRWKQVLCEGKRPCARYGHASAVVGLNLFVYGGVGRGEAEEFFLRDLWAFSSSQKSWLKVSFAGLSVAERAYAGMCAVDNSLLIFGGKFERADAEQFDKFLRVTFSEL